MKTVSTAEMRAWEQKVLQSGMRAEFLMQHAVSGLMARWIKRFPRPGQALFFCGKGHNGNDGLWLAELLRRHGWDVAIVLSHQPSQRRAVESAEVRASIQHASVWPQTPEFPGRTGKIRILVDALLGTGASGAPRGMEKELLSAMAGLSSSFDFKISLDAPSGIDADTGQPFPDAFRADLTMCLGAIKKGLLQDQARPWVGRLDCIPLPLPLETCDASGSDTFHLQDAHSLARHLSASSHKYQRGTLSVWAGSPGMGGAALLSAGSGLRAGAGLVRLYTHPGLESAILQSHPEIMTWPLTPAALPAAFFKAKAWVLGPGIGVTDENFTILKNLLTSAPCPLVIDADALTLLARDTGLLNECHQPVLLTPHHGELERLLGEPFVERSSAADIWLKRHPSTILIAKGPNTLVAANNQRLSHNGSGNPGMASAGMGDVLSGILGSLLAQGYAPWDAARLGVYWHGLAADHAAESQTEQCLNACDLISHLGSAWKEIIALNASDDMLDVLPASSIN